jgi:hypothetical protein
MPSRGFRHRVRPVFVRRAFCVPRVGTGLGRLSLFMLRDSSRSHPRDAIVSVRSRSPSGATPIVWRMLVRRPERSISPNGLSQKDVCRFHNLEPQLRTSCTPVRFRLLVSVCPGRPAARAAASSPAPSTPRCPRRYGSEQPNARFRSNRRRLACGQGALDRRP